jgi:hypothetical protein
MIDFDPILQQMLRTGWSNGEAKELLKAIVGMTPGSRVDWEEGDEEWGRVLSREDKVLALVSAKFPLSFVTTTVSGQMLFPASVTVLSVKDMAEPQLRATRELMEQVFERPLSDNLDYGNLSAEDIWWTTV